MRQDPTYLLWLVTTPSVEDAHRLQKELAETITPDALFVNEVRTGPHGTPLLRKESHRFGDYFESIRMLSLASHEPSFRVLFHRRQGAGRFWKDLMVRALQRVRQLAPETTTTMVYQGDEQPDVVPAER